MGRPPLLLFESENDLHVCKNLCYKRVSNYEAIEYKSCNGVDGVLSAALAELAIRDDDRRLCIGLIVDTDTSLKDRWDDVQKVVCEMYTSIPPLPNDQGTILIENAMPRLGIWLMPNNTSSGALEEFITELIPAEDRLWTQAQEVVRNLVEQRFKDKARPKADIHTWLAWQQEPGRPMGYAVSRGFLNRDATLAVALVEWVCRLVEA